MKRKKVGKKSKARKPAPAPRPMPYAPPDDRARCGWVRNGNELMFRYHDEEWGVPVRDDRVHFEFLILEAAQAGLSWSTVLNKREGYRRAFSGLDPRRVARFDKRSIKRLMQFEGIIRNRLKIEAAIEAAQRFLEVQREFGSFDRYVWQFVAGGRPRQNRIRGVGDIMATTPESDALSKDLKKRGFRFVGSTIIYAYMQAIGMVNDHAQDCFRQEECAALAW